MWWMIKIWNNIQQMLLLLKLNRRDDIKTIINRCDFNMIETQNIFFECHKIEIIISICDDIQLNFRFFIKMKNNNTQCIFLYNWYASRSNENVEKENLTKKITFHIFVRIFHFRHNEFDMQKINVLRSQSHQYYQKNVVNCFRVF